jgi:hypothetical protein
MPVEVDGEAIASGPAKADRLAVGEVVPTVRLEGLSLVADGREHAKYVRDAVARDEQVDVDHGTEGNVAVDRGTEGSALEDDGTEPSRRQGAQRAVQGTLEAHGAGEAGIVAALQGALDVLREEALRLEHSIEQRRDALLRGDVGQCMPVERAAGGEGTGGV